MGFEPMNSGFADRRVSLFATAPKPLKQTPRRRLLRNRNYATEGALG